MEITPAIDISLFPKTSYCFQNGKKLKHEGGERFDEM